MQPTGQEHKVEAFITKQTNQEIVSEPSGNATVISVQNIWRVNAARILKTWRSVWGRGIDLLFINHAYWRQVVLVKTVRTYWTPIIQNSSWGIEVYRHKTSFGRATWNPTAACDELLQYKKTRHVDGPCWDEVFSNAYLGGRKDSVSLHETFAFSEVVDKLTEIKSGTIFRVWFCLNRTQCFGRQEKCLKRRIYVFSLVHNGE